MKRCNNPAYPQIPPRKVFRITSGVPIPEKSEKVLPILNEDAFKQMTDEEKRRCFQQQAYEIKQLRRKLRKCDNSEFNFLEAEHKRAQMLLEGGEYELSDQKELLSNVTKGINTDKLLPGTLAYNRVCTILRSRLGIKVDKVKAEQISFPDKSVAITQKEKVEYRHLPRNEGVFRALVGEDTVATKAGGDEVERYLGVQSELLKNMTYGQFLACIKRQKGSR